MERERERPTTRKPASGRLCFQIPRIEPRNFRVKDFLQGPLFDKITIIPVSPKSPLVQITKDYSWRAYSIHPGYPRSALI